MVNRPARFGRRLLADTSGNTMAMAATAVLMLMAAVGGGIDMSRAYMTKTNLQAACDAGVLAGRRAMSKSGTYGSAEKAKATKMFNFNMHASQTASTDVVFDTEDHDDGSVTGTASATMPTAVMKIFAVKKFDLDVECSAELQMASADVMFVLDVTGSMAGTKIQGLRDAVREFHKTVAGAVIDKDETVIRYGFVPYSMTVNASELVSTGAMSTEWFADNTLYQSRVAVFDTSYQIYPANTPTTAAAVTETYGSLISSSNCTKYGNNTYPSSSGKNPVAGGGPAPTATTSTQYAYLSWTRSGTSSNGTCRRTRTVTTTTYETVQLWKFTKWRYKPATIDTAGLVGSSGLPLVKSLSSSNYVPTKGEYDMRTLAKMVGETNTSLPSASNYAWTGCIEERGTVVDFASNPDDAHDLNINDEPEADDDNTKWKPYWGTVEYYRSNASGSDSGSTVTERCPAPMRQFEEVDTSSTDVPGWLDTYLNNLAAVGNTYHDIGMIWGARLGSTKGMYQDNVLDGDRVSVSRHIIFMTDGVMEPDREGYNAYGIEVLDNRIAPSGATDGSGGTLATYHTSRFLAACQAAKNEGYTVWAISFGTAITNAMKTCSSADRYYYASNTTELKSAFRYIAGQVADLRINK